MMTRADLEQWLGDPPGESLAIGELSDVLHVVLDASRRSISLANPGELRELRFALIVLRDIFPHDAAIRTWLRSPSSEWRGLAPADLVSDGRIREFADLAVSEWNRPHVDDDSAVSGIERFVIHGTLLA